MSMLFIFHIVQCFIFMAVQSIKFNGSCPEIAAEDHFNCNDSNSVNLFERYETLVNKYVHDCLFFSFHRSHFLRWVTCQSRIIHWTCSLIRLIAWIVWVSYVNWWNISIKITESNCRQFDASRVIRYHFGWKFRAMCPMILMLWSFVRCQRLICHRKSRVLPSILTTWLTTANFALEFWKMSGWWSLWSANI